MDRAKTMAIVNRLRGRAISVREKLPTDGRKQTLNLTDQGRCWRKRKPKSRCLKQPALTRPEGPLLRPPDAG